MANATKIMIIRHAEKPAGAVQAVNIDGNAGPENLTVQGWQRAGALARFFAPESSQFQRAGIAEPGFLFASGPVTKQEKKDDGDGSKSERPVQTITPLSQLFDVTIDQSFVKGQEAEVAAAAMNCGGVALIAWQHEDIPTIAAAIPGASGFPKKWPANRFDVVWVFDLQADNTYVFGQVPQNVAGWRSGWGDYWVGGGPCDLGFLGELVVDLLILLLIFGIAAWLRRRVGFDQRRGKRGRGCSEDCHRHLARGLFLRCGMASAFLFRATSAKPKAASAARLSGWPVTASSK